jgi:hypothetical protein
MGLGQLVCEYVGLDAVESTDFVVVTSAGSSLLGGSDCPPAFLCAAFYTLHQPPLSALPSYWAIPVSPSFAANAKPLIELAQSGFDTQVEVAKDATGRPFLVGSWDGLRPIGGNAIDGGPMFTNGDAIFAVTQGHLSHNFIDRIPYGGPLLRGNFENCASWRPGYVFRSVRSATAILFQCFCLNTKPNEKRRLFDETPALLPTGHGATLLTRSFIEISGDTLVHLWHDEKDEAPGIEAYHIELDKKNNTPRLALLWSGRGPRMTLGDSEFASLHVDHETDRLWISWHRNRRRVAAFLPLSNTNNLPRYDTNLVVAE